MLAARERFVSIHIDRISQQRPHSCSLSARRAAKNLVCDLRPTSARRGYSSSKIVHKA